MKSRLIGLVAGRDLRPGDVLVDLVARRPEFLGVGHGDDDPGEEMRLRTVAERIPKGTRIELRDDGKLYPAAG